MLVVAGGADPARADGGAGGDIFRAGPPGGAGYDGAPGADGGTFLSYGLGGGGGGAGGGNGGSGGPSGSTAAPGGAGGTQGSPDGADAPFVENASYGQAGGGGGGGFNGNGSGTTAIVNGSQIVGGNGGRGGRTDIADGFAGGGGAGGYGAIVTGATVNLTNGTILGGNGGNGGDSNGAGGGGDGGVGARFTVDGASLTNAGTIGGGNGGRGGDSDPNLFGGNGGRGGTGIEGANLTIANSGTIIGGRGGRRGVGPSSIDGAGGAGIAGSNLVIVNGGAISGGLGGGGQQADAITFTGGINVLELRAGSVITGNVVAVSGGSDALRLGGSGNTSFDVGSIGIQYQNFASFEKTGSGIWTLTGSSAALTPWTISGGTLAISQDASLGDPSGGLVLNGGTLGFNGGLVTTRGITLAGSGTIDTNGNAVTLQGTIGGSGGLVKAGAGTLTLLGNNIYTGGTAINAGTLAISTDSNLGAAGGALTFNGGTLQLLAPLGTLLRPVTLAAGGGAIDTNGFDTQVGTTIGGPGGLTKSGAGRLVIGVPMTYAGGTTVNAGALVMTAGASLNPAGALAVNGGTFDMSAPGANQTVGALSGAGGVLALGANTLTTNGAVNTTLGSAIGGTGSLVKAGSGILTLTGNSDFTGGTTIIGGGLVVNGSLASGVAMNGGTLGGSGTIAGLVVNAGTIAPGNSIGTLTVNGNLVQGSGSTYQVEVNAAGQSDKINVGGTATINGGAVQVLAQQGTYARNTTYTILSASGGVSGAYSSVSSNFAFLTPSLTYNANNVFLTLFQNSSAFAAGAQTSNQYAVGTVLDQVNASATGDLYTVMNALSVLSSTQGPAALNAISGQQYADFGTLNVQGGMLFMNAVGQQMALARGRATGGGQRHALAQACEIENCDAMSQWGAWASALGGLGSVAGNGNSSTLTYNFGGAAAGIDYRLDPRFLVGLGAGYTSATQWVNSFMGRGWSDSVSVTAYGSFTQAAFYTDALAGYAWSGNQMQRQIMIPGLQPRTANGSTSANQFLGQVESGYKLGIYALALASITPFGRFQVMSVNQGGFSEWGSANSLNLNVAQQATTSLRSTFGAELAGAIGLGDTRTLDLALRLGWQHEFADTGRPITAAFAGTPSNAFTVYGATPQRDAAIIGFQAGTFIAAATSIYLRYDGAIGNGTDNHTLNVGMRLSW